MVKAANVEFLLINRVAVSLPSSLPAVTAVKAAMTPAAASRIGEITGVQVIPRPNSDVEKFFPQFKSPPSRRIV